MLEFTVAFILYAIIRIALLVYYSNRFLKIVKGNDLLPF